MWALVWSRLSGCRANIRGNQTALMGMAGGEGASTRDCMRNNKDPNSEDFTQLGQRLEFLLAE